MDSPSTPSCRKRLQSHASQSSFSPSSSSSSSSSWSSSSSFRSNSFPLDLCDKDLSPSSPLASCQLSSVPFSWEELPGVPKKYNHHSLKKGDASLTLLPLPPSAGATLSRRFNLDAIFTFGKKTSHGSLESDPFAVALVECSKDAGHRQVVQKYWKVSRVVNDRFDLYASCKSSCAVAESKILLPKSMRK